MIDRLEVLVPNDVPIQPNEWRKYLVKRARLGFPYALTLDADDALSLRIHHKHRVPVRREKRHFKVDFTGTRLLTAEDMLWRLISLFQIQREQALSFQVARVDLAADVYGVPVEWFRQHSRVKRKRRPQSYEAWKADSSKGAVTSVVFGKRPDLYRIYDRIAEKKKHGKEILHAGLSSGVPSPIVTRVERQCTGRSISKEFRTLDGLIKHAADVQPFPQLVCSHTVAERVADDNWPPRRWLLNIGLATAVRQYGEATVRARLNRGGKNAKRFFEQYSDMLRSDQPGVTAEQLREIYRSTTIRQLNVPVTGPDGEARYPAGGFVLTL